MKSPAQGFPTLLIVEEYFFSLFLMSMSIPQLSPLPRLPCSHPALASSLNHCSTSERVSTTVWQWGLLRYWEQKQAGVHKVVMTLWYCNKPWGGAQTTSSLLASSGSKTFSAKYSSAFNYYIKCESQEVNKHVLVFFKLCFDCIHTYINTVLYSTTRLTYHYFILWIYFIIISQKLEIRLNFIAYFYIWILSYNISTWFSETKIKIS